MVPPSTAELLTRWGIAERIRRLLGDAQDHGRDRGVADVFVSTGLKARGDG
jgi:hypothetical protein